MKAKHSMTRGYASKNIFKKSHYKPSVAEKQTKTKKDMVEMKQNLCSVPLCGYISGAIDSNGNETPPLFWDEETQTYKPKTTEPKGINEST